MYKYFEMNNMQTYFFPSIANLKRTPSGRPMHPYYNRGTCTPVWEPIV